MSFFEKVVNYLKESFGELKKVTWPKKDEVISSTVVIIIFVIIVALLLFVFDFTARELVNYVINPDYKLLDNVFK